MAFGGKQNQAALRISADRLASVAGGASAAYVEEAAPSSAGPARRVMVEPDLSRIRPRGVEETDDDRKRRLTAKTMNFGATFLARLIIMGAVAKFGYDTYEMTGMFPRGVGFGLFAMTADFGRVIVKAMTPGTK